MNKKVVITLGVIVAVILLAAFYFFVLKNRNNSKFSIEKQELGMAEIPVGFPRNLPIEAGSQILQNYEASTTDGRIQSTRVVTTKKPLDQAVKVYEDFFVKDGWKKIPDTSATTGVMTAIFRKGDNLLLIKAKTTPELNQSTIELSLTEAKK